MYFIFYVVDAHIDVETLKYIKPRHIDKLLLNHPLGILIKFENHLETWQRSLQKKPTSQIDSALVFEVQNLQTFEKLKPTNSNPKMYDVHVHTILANSSKGKLLIDYYNTNLELNNTIRGTLVDLIIHDIISNNIPMSISLAESVAEQIAFMFPSEIKASVKI